MNKLEILLQMRMIKIFATILVVGFTMQSNFAFGQDADQEELSIIEVELDRSAPKKEEINPRASQPDKSTPANIEFSGLGKLAPFREVSIIQKKFLPKTERFQISGGPSIVTNDPFFNTLGGNVNLGYFFTETIGLEAKYFMMDSSESKATKELYANNNVTTSSIISTKGYFGLDLMYVPIYGKMTWFNNRIIPFDLYFSAGAGSTQLSQSGKESNASTVHFGTGQIFALTKAWGFRWDFSWNFFSAKQSFGSGTETSNFNNLYLTVGVSYFFPEAKYR